MLQSVINKIWGNTRTAEELQKQQLETADAEKLSRLNQMVDNMSDFFCDGKKMGMAHNFKKLLKQPVEKDGKSYAEIFSAYKTDLLTRGATIDGKDPASRKYRFLIEKRDILLENSHLKTDEDIQRVFSQILSKIEVYNEAIQEAKPKQIEKNTDENSIVAQNQAGIKNKVVDIQSKQPPKAQLPAPKVKQVPKKISSDTKQAAPKKTLKITPADPISQSAPVVTTKTIPVQFHTGHLSPSKEITEKDPLQVTDVSDLSGAINVQDINKAIIGFKNNLRIISTYNEEELAARNDLSQAVSVEAIYEAQQYLSVAAESLPDLLDTAENDYEKNELQVLMDEYAQLQQKNNEQVSVDHDFSEKGIIDVALKTAGKESAREEFKKQTRELLAIRTEQVELLSEKIEDEIESFQDLYVGICQGVFIAGNTQSLSERSDDIEMRTLLEEIHIAIERYNITYDLFQKTPRVNVKSGRITFDDMQMKIKNISTGHNFWNISSLRKEQSQEKITDYRTARSNRSKKREASRISSFDKRQEKAPDNNKIIELTDYQEISSEDEAKDSLKQINE
ncbi:hypothetical protein COB57_02025 [Candidatus Peregrinibacteria bacterium]|nr:MAG: hypothetical protein COB57_02025 [Candidatus Peregrinibacteria bacterium]